MRLICIVLLMCTATAYTSSTNGRASFYAGKWIGRLTANGEYYKASDVTAAHKFLPFNTRVKVTNLKNGKSVIVRINNRGPYIRGRDIDLSIVAAKQIDMIVAGVVPVRMEVLNPARKKSIVKFRIGQLGLALYPPRFRVGEPILRQDNS